MRLLGSTDRLNNAHPKFCTTMSQFPDYYKLLGIPQTATQEEIRQAYRKESLKFVLLNIRLVLTLVTLNQDPP